MTFYSFKSLNTADHGTCDKALNGIQYVSGGKVLRITTFDRILPGTLAQESSPGPQIQ